MAVFTGDRIRDIFVGGLSNALTIYGLGGDDELTGSVNDDTIFGGTGDDYLRNGGGGDDIYGGPGDDLIFTDAEEGDRPNILDGGTGVDTMRGSLNNNIYYVDNVEDTVYEVEWTDPTHGGVDEVRSSVDFSLIDPPFGTFPHPTTGLLDGQIENLTLLGRGDLTGIGNSLDNVLRGNAGANAIDAMDGDDTVFGQGGTDTLDGGTGNDTLSGGAGADKIFGGADDDDLSGNGGADTLNGGDGSDTLNGGGGEDVLNGDDGNDTLTGGKGSDTFVLKPSSGTDTVTDFKNGKDLFALMDDLSFDDLEFLSDHDGGVEIALAETGEVLALLESTRLGALDQADFFIL
jgi:Ca2+-binding RTX toxin-like protein